MASKDNSRKTEGILLLGVLLFILLPALALVFWGKKRTEPPADAVMVNEASPKTFALTLGIPPEIANRLTAYRMQRGGFSSSDEILDAPLFPSSEAERLVPLLTRSGLDLKTAAAAKFASVLNIAQPTAHRLAAYRDSLLPPPFTEEDVEASGRSGGQPKSASSPIENRKSKIENRTLQRLNASYLLRHAPLLDPSETRLLLKRLIVRRPETVTAHFWMGVGALTLIALLLPPWLRARGVGGDPFLLPLTLLLFGLGVVLLFSVKDPLRDRAVYEHHLLGLIPSLLILSVLARLAPQVRGNIKRYSYLWVIAALLLVGGLFLFGNGPEGVKLNLFHLQPVEIIKLFLVFFLAGYLADHADLITDSSRRGSGSAWSSQPNPSKIENRKSKIHLPRPRDLGPVVVMFAVALTMFLVIKDMGPGLLLFATFVITLCLTTGRGSFLLTGVVLLAAGALLAYSLHIGVFTTRVDMWLSPFANAHPNGMQLGQSYWAMASGGWEGNGLGLGMGSLIPRGGSDLAFATWTEETGLFGAWLALVVYVLLVWRGLKIGLQAGSPFDRALAFGLTTLLGMQALLILGGVTGALPLAGISLPFMSYGNSALVADFAIIGLLRGISSPSSRSGSQAPVRPETAAVARRFALVFAALLLGGIGIWRMGMMQLLRADEIATRPITTPDADGVKRPHINPRLLALEHQIERGSIYDRAGRVLATSRAAEIAQSVKDPRAARRMADRRGRLYPYGPALAHLVGYLDPGVGGPFGMEKGYNADLRGFAQEADLLYDYRHRFFPFYQPRRGKDLHLTLDAELQKEAQNLLGKTVSKLKDTKNGKVKDRAAFVLMRPDTGEVIVAVSLPSFDPNGLTPEKMRQLAVGPDAEYEHALLNRAVRGAYPPGSTMKVATTACALDTLPDAENFSVVCNKVSGEIRWQANGKTYKLHNIHDDRGDPNFGALTLPHAFTVSSNIYFANLAANLDPNVFHSILVDKMGFKRIPKQAAFDADLPYIGFGQGRMLASPVEMCRLAGSVADNGVAQSPRFVTHLTDPAKRIPPKEIALPQPTQAMTEKTAVRLRDLMRSVTTSGTARSVFDGLPYAVAGKTGTAQNLEYDREPHSWFIGFAPYGESSPPRYAFACVVENGGYGKKVAAVICRDVLKKALVK